MSFGTCPAATLALWTACRISSTTSGLASVVVSPTSTKLEIAAVTRLMILPERVLGRSAETHTWAGRAMGPIIVAIAPLTSSTTSWLSSYPGLRDMYISGTRPLSSSTAGTAAASLTASTVSAADSSSFVPRRCPATLITSSTLPTIR